jgi:hypothetical protein
MSEVWGGGGGLDSLGVRYVLQRRPVIPWETTKFLPHLSYGSETTRYIECRAFIYRVVIKMSAMGGSVVNT